jgi:hypothetical protein
LQINVFPSSLVARCLCSPFLNTVIIAIFERKPSTKRIVWMIRKYHIINHSDQAAYKAEKFAIYARLLKQKDGISAAETYSQLKKGSPNS